MKRRIIHIDEEKCNGCGACTTACHEGAIGMVNGKAKLLRDDYCDGLGDCLPACPTGAITFVEREAAAYNEQAVEENRRQAMKAQGQTPLHRSDVPGSSCAGHPEEKHQGGSGIHQGGCPGGRIRQLHRSAGETPAPTGAAVPPSRLMQWPCQIRLVPVNAPYFADARLLIAADCTAYAYANLHEEFMRGRITLIGCPKLDSVDYSEKLTAILKENDIRSVTVLRMEVPCCGGLEAAARQALQNSGKMIPWQVVTVTIDGSLQES